MIFRATRRSLRTGSALTLRGDAGIEENPNGKAGFQILAALYGN
jgi:hypothetical protein